MNRFKLIVGVLVAALAVEFVVAILLTVLVYQVTPKSVLGRQTFIGNIPGLLSSVRLVDRSINLLYWGSRAPETLPHYELRVDPKDLEKIEESLPTQLPSPWYGNVFLTEDGKEWADGLFIADGNQYNVEIRVRGDIFNHWAYRKKSWRIRFPKGVLYNGMSEFNLIIPEDRGWIAEPLNRYRAKQLGFIQPPMRYVTVSLNGSGPMIYTEIEHWTKEMLIKEGKKHGNLFGAGGGTSYFQQWDDVFADTAYWQKYVTTSGSTVDSFAEVDALKTLSRPNAHNEPGYKERVAALIDPQDLIEWYALSLLSGSSHVRDHNLRFYSDGTKLSPIPWDISLYYPRSLLSLPGNPFLNEVFRVPEWKLAAHKLLWKHISDPAKIEADLAEAKRLRAMVERAAYRDSMKLQSNRQVKNELDTRMTQIQANFDWLKTELGISEVLIHQIVPSLAEQKRGVLAELEFTTRGVSAAKLLEVAVPTSFAGQVALVRDDGDGIFETSDVNVPFKVRDQRDLNGRAVLETTDELRSLIWPGEPVIGPSEEVLAAPHTLHRFFLVRTRGNGSLGDKDFPLALGVKNAVTGTAAHVIGQVIIDERRL